MILILMGVAGSGKSSVAEALAEQTGWLFAEGDEFHPEINREKMAAGVPLTDQDRAPWLDSLHQVLLSWEREGVSGILTCSALKKSYREQLMRSIPNSHLVWLDPPLPVLESRLAHRTGHYFNPALLESQLETLEPPAEGENVLHFTSLAPPEDLARQILAHFTKK
jgi:gluconokinase